MGPRAEIMDINFRKKKKLPTAFKYTNETQLINLDMRSSGQSFWLQVERSRVRFPALPDFLSSSGSGTGSTQPREVN